MPFSHSPRNHRQPIGDHECFHNLAYHSNYHPLAFGKYYNTNHLHAHSYIAYTNHDSNEHLHTNLHLFHHKTVKSNEESYALPTLSLLVYISFYTSLKQNKILTNFLNSIHASQHHNRNYKYQINDEPNPYQKTRKN